MLAVKASVGRRRGRQAPARVIGMKLPATRVGMFHASRRMVNEKQQVMRRTPSSSSSAAAAPARAAGVSAPLRGAVAVRAAASGGLAEPAAPAMAAAAASRISLESGTPRLLAPLLGPAAPAAVAAATAGVLYPDVLMLPLRLHGSCAATAAAVAPPPPDATLSPTTAPRAAARRAALVAALLLLRTLSTHEVNTAFCPASKETAPYFCGAVPSEQGDSRVCA